MSARLDRDDVEPDVLVSGLIPTVGDGTALARASRERWPELNAEEAFDGRTDFPGKPFTPAELLREIRNLTGLE